MIERFKKFFPNRNITNIRQFIAKAKKEACTVIVLNCACCIEEKMTGFSSAMTIGFRISYTAHKDEKEIAQFIQHVFAYKPDGKSKTKRRKELRRYYGNVRSIAKKMKVDIKREFPAATVIRTSSLEKR